MADEPSENLTELLAHDDVEGPFESLLGRYAVHSGISGAMPKVLVRDSGRGYALGHVTHRGATHIVKAWTDEYPQLAFYFNHALTHPKWQRVGIFPSLRGQPFDRQRKHHHAVNNPLGDFYAS